MAGKIIAGIIATFQIAILFILFFIFLNELQNTGLGKNPQSKAVLEQSEKSLKNIFDWWLIIDTIGGIVIFSSVIFSIIYLVMKIAEKYSYGPI